MGAGGDLSREAVHSVVSSLECSPSKSDTSGYHGGAPNLQVTAKSSKSATSPTHLETSTSEFKMSDRGNKLPNYQGQFAKHAQEV